jgi:hypothetical protein
VEQKKKIRKPSVKVDIKLFSARREHFFEKIKIYLRKIIIRDDEPNIRNG